MAKINQEDLIFKDIFGKIASDGWQSIDLEKLSHECDFDVLNVTGGIRNKIDLLVAFSALIDTTVNQSIDADTAEVVVEEERPELHRHAGAHEEHEDDLRREPIRGGSRALSDEAPAQLPCKSFPLFPPTPL